MNGYTNRRRHIQQDPKCETRTQVLFMTVEPDYESPKTYQKYQNARKGSSRNVPKILNFSLNQEKQRLEHTLRKEPEFIFDEDSGTYLHYYTEDVTSTSYKLEVEEDVVSPPSQCFQIKFNNESQKAKTSAPRPIAIQRPVQKVEAPPVNRVSHKLPAHKPPDPIPPVQAPQAPPQPPSPQPNVMRKLYKCAVCSELFERSYQLKRHHFVSHTTSKKPPPNRTAHPSDTTITKSNPPVAAPSKPFQFAPIHPVNRIPVHSPAPPIVKPIIQMFKSPIFTNGSIPIRVIPKPTTQITNSTRSVHIAPSTHVMNHTTISRIPNVPDNTHRDLLLRNNTTLSITSRHSVKPTQNTPNPPIATSRISAASHTHNAPPSCKPTTSAPRIVVRKEVPNSSIFTEDTQHEWSQISYEVPLDGSDIRFKCAVCDETYEHLPKLDVHLQIHNGQAFRFKCELCDEFVMSVAHLRNHVHSHTRSHLPIKCEKCERRFIDEPAVYRHECLQQSAAVCHPCRKSFLTPDLLKSHHFVHTGVKPYKCETCEDRFIHLSTLSKHQECETMCSSLYPNTEFAQS